MMWMRAIAGHRPVSAVAGRGEIGTGKDGLAAGFPAALDAATGSGHKAEPGMPLAPQMTPVPGLTARQPADRPADMHTGLLVPLPPGEALVGEAVQRLVTVPNAGRTAQFPSTDVTAGQAVELPAPASAAKPALQWPIAAEAPAAEVAGAPTGVPDLSVGDDPAPTGLTLPQTSARELRGSPPVDARLRHAAAVAPELSPDDAIAPPPTARKATAPVGTGTKLRLRVRDAVGALHSGPGLPEYLVAGLATPATPQPTPTAPGPSQRGEAMPGLVKAALPPWAAAVGPAASNVQAALTSATPSPGTIADRGTPAAPVGAGPAVARPMPPASRAAPQTALQRVPQAIPQAIRQASPRARPESPQRNGSIAVAANRPSDGPDGVEPPQRATDHGVGNPAQPATPAQPGASGLSPRLASTVAAAIASATTQPGEKSPDLPAAVVAPAVAAAPRERPQDAVRSDDVAAPTSPGSAVRAPAGRLRQPNAAPAAQAAPVAEAIPIAPAAPAALSEGNGVVVAAVDVETRGNQPAADQAPLATSPTPDQPAGDPQVGVAGSVASVANRPPAAPSAAAQPGFAASLVPLPVQARVDQGAAAAPPAPTLTSATATGLPSLASGTGVLPGPGVIAPLPVPNTPPVASVSQSATVTVVQAAPMLPSDAGAPPPRTAPRPGEPRIATEASSASAFGTPVATPAATSPAASANSANTAPAASAPAPSDLVVRVSDQVIGALGRGSHEIVLHLHPRELGELSVRLHVSGREVAAWFDAPQAPVQQAIALGMGQLHADLASAGYSLTSAWVGGDTWTPRGRGGGPALPRQGRGASPVGLAEQPRGATPAAAGSGVSVYV